MDAEELIESIIRAIMFLAGIVGNSLLVAHSLPAQRSGIRANEVLFINLALSNLITNYLVDLPDTMADFAGRWFLGKTFCGVFRFCADLSETSSIYTTFFISTFWHQKLVGSLKRGGAPVWLDNLRLVGCLLAGSWTVAVVFSIPHFFFVVVEVTNESVEDCIDVFPNAFAQQTYEIFYLSLANAIPAAGIAFTTIQIVITIVQNHRRIRNHNSDPTKEKMKEPVSDDSGPNPTKASRHPEPPAQVDSGLPASSRPNQEQSAQGSTGPPVSQDAESRAGASPAAPRAVTKTAAKASRSSSSQLRAAKSVVAVASVFLICWLTHLLLRITNSIHTSSMVVEVASYIAASYTCIIPYIFLHGVKKLSCSCKR